MWSQLSSFIATERSSAKASKASSKPRVLLLCNDQQESELRSSLGFRLAYESAESGLHVFFVCLKGKFDRGFPWPVVVTPATTETSQTESITSYSSAWSPSILSRIHIKYVTNTLELQKVFASMHTFLPRPQCVVVDHLCSIIDPIGTIARNDATFVQACLMIGSFARDCVDFFDKDSLSKQRQQQHHHDPEGVPEQCQLVITADCFDVSFVNSMRRSITHVLSLRPLPPSRHSVHHDHLLGMFVKGPTSENDVQLCTCVRGMVDNGHSYQLMSSHP